MTELELMMRALDGNGIVSSRAKEIFERANWYPYCGRERASLLALVAALDELFEKSPRGTEAPVLFPGRRI